MAKKKRLTKQQRRLRAKKHEQKRIADAKDAHFEKQIAFINHAASQIKKPSPDRFVIPRKSISMRVPAPMLNDLDYLAIERGISRSELIMLALDAYIHDPNYLPTGDYTGALENDI